MYITIDETDERPIYQQLVDEIKAIIAAGELAEGASLPPVRQVAADLGINLNTVAFAYRKLRNEGLVKVRHGSGAIVSARTKPRADREQLEAKLMPVLTDLLLAGLSKAEIVALVTSGLNSLQRERPG